MTDWRGHDRPLAEMLAGLEGQRLHHAWLLAGPSGIGKAGIAHDFAKLLLGAERRTDGFGPVADDPVARLVDAGTHPDFVMIERLLREAKKGEPQTLARNIAIGQIRALDRMLHMAPSMGGRRVILIDGAEDMEAGAANALLKNLEEPPRDTVFLLISHAPGRLLPTIRSRCRVVHFHPLGDADMEAALAAAEPGLSDTDVQALIRGAEGAPGRAMAMRALDLPVLEAALDRIAQTGDPNHRERIALARTLAPKAAQPRYEAFLDLVPHYIARRLRTAPGGDAALWGEAVALGQGAVTLSLDPASTIFGLCGTVARLAEARG